MDDDDARARVLESADRLFNADGIRAVGMDGIRDASGVSLKRLYRLYPAKEHLVEAWLRRRDTTFRQALADHIADRPAPHDKVLAIFDFLDDWFREPDFRGCPFVNAFAEMSATSSAVRAAVEDQKHALEALFASLTPDEPELAEQLFILANGAMVAAGILRTPEPARQAKAAAALLLSRTKRGSGSPGR